MRFLHLADLHIGTENYGRVDAATGLHSRVADFVQSVRFAFDHAVQQHADFALFCGDAYRTCDPTPTHQRELAGLVRGLVRHGIPLVMVVGNHDNPVAFGRASSIDIYGTLEVEGVRVVSKPALLVLETAGGPVQIVGFPWPTRNLLMTQDEYKDLSDEQILAAIQEKTVSIIGDLAEDLDPALPAVLAAHLTCAEATLSGSERSALVGRDPVLMTSALAHPSFDYVALGHIHKHQDLNGSGAPHVVYSGSIERVDFGEEREPKGFCMVTIEGKGRDAGGRTTTYEFVESPARRFVTIEVDVGQDEDPTDVILREASRHNLDGAVVRVVYRVSESQQQLLDLKRVHAALQGAFLVSSILPRVAPVEHVRRVEVSEDLGVGEALKRYIENHPELEHLREDMTRCAAALQEELEAPDASADLQLEED